MERRKRTKRLLAILLCLVMLLSVLTGCGATKGGADTGETKTVVVYVADIFNTLNPFDTGAFSDSDVFNQVYESIAKTDDKGDPVPCLGESWEISTDGLVYTIKLVKDAVFTNGEN